MQTEKGRIADWNDEKGFGFITPESGGKKVFFHINAYSSRHKRPLRNLEVQYFLSLDPKGRACAVDVVPTNGHKDNGREIRQKFTAVALFAGFAAMLSFLFQIHRLPLEIVYLYIVMSALAFFLYAKDKNAAESGTWRTSENTLHFVSILGGWPGAKIAQSFLRHKSKKLSFRILYWATVCINCGALFWLITPRGSLWLKTLLRQLNLG
jgi:uncharacterized membrane protein YsdA (DUF1294 family)/cold shock CspA family protein